MLGFFYGIFKSAKEIPMKNRPKKLIFTSVINTVGKQTSRFANTGAALALMYIFTKKFLNFTLSEEFEDLTENQKQLAYGFTTGFMFKFWTKGFKSGILSGVMMSVLCFGLGFAYDKTLGRPKKTVNPMMYSPVQGISGSNVKSSHLI
jgi:hypothetical protein